MLKALKVVRALDPWITWTALIVGLCLLIGCASTPKAGPCTVTACGWECCNGDGTPCPPCWEER